MSEIKGDILVNEVSEPIRGEEGGDSVVDIAGKIEVRSGKPISSRREFFRAIGDLAKQIPTESLSGSFERVQGQNAGNTELVLSIVLPPLFAWVRNGTTPRVRERRGIIALAVGGILTILAGGGIYRLKQGERIGEKKRKERELKSLPQDWQEGLRIREKLEREMGYDNYRSGTDKQIYIGNITHPLVRRWTGLYGATWMFVPERKQDLETLFGRKFSEEDFLRFRADPASAQEAVQLIDGLVQKSVYSEDVLAFYRKSLTPEGKKEIFDAYEKEFSVSK